MDRARELGITYFDTANNYGGGVGLRGQVEQMMNRWFREGDKRRESVILASKFGLEVGGGRRRERRDGPLSLQDAPFPGALTEAAGHRPSGALYHAPMRDRQPIGTTRSGAPTKT